MTTHNLPTISIVTPSLNQGNFIEKTILSVIEQHYPNLEFLIVDGGSTDNTLDILKKYDQHIRWFSERDSGQTNAINKGLRMTGGTIVAYLNADDILLPSSLMRIAKSFLDNPEINWITGKCAIIDEQGRNFRSTISFYKNLLLFSRSYRVLLITNYLSQPATFWRRTLMEKCGMLDESFNYVMDYEYWLRLWQATPPHIIRNDLAGFRIQRNSKTTTFGHSLDYIEEEKRILERYAPSKIWKYLHNFHRVVMTKVYSWINH